MRGVHFYLPIIAMLASSLLLCVSAKIADIKVPSRTLELPLEDDSLTSNSCPLGSALHKETDACHPLEGESPCGKSMVFVVDRANPGFGTCVCKYGRETNCVGKPVGYWKKTNQCYPLFEQGPCRKYEWLVPGRNGSLECQQSICSVTLSSDIKLPSPVFTFALNRTCYETNKQAFCGSGLIAVFMGSDYTPKCISKSIKKQYCYSSELNITKLLGPQL